MLEDIKLEPITIDFEGLELQLEFDNSSIAFIEQQTGKGIFKIQALILANDITLQDSIEVFCAGIAKHHDIEVIKKVRESLQKKPYLISLHNKSVTNAFMKPLFPPEIYIKIAGEKKHEKKPKVQTESNGNGNITQQQQSSAGRRKNSGKQTLEKD
jgi:hypothetical protein